VNPSLWTTARIAKHAAQNAEHRAVGAPKVQLPDLFADQQHGGAEFGVGTFEVDDDSI
jgi:hypothetical protein